MIRRLALLAVLLLPAVILGVWLLTEQLPAWTAPRYWWITPLDAPAACAALATLTAYHAARIEEATAVSATEALKRAEKAIQWQYNLPVPPERTSDPLLVSATIDGEAHRAWLITAALEVGGTVVYLDAETGDPLAHIAAVTPNAACQFDVRSALVDMARSRAFLLFAGYVGALMAGGVVWLVIGRLRKPVAVT